MGSLLANSTGAQGLPVQINFEGFFIKDYFLNGTVSSEQEIQVIINTVNQGNSEVIEVIIE